MQVTAFVPLKLNNERLPGKNTKKFCNGVPLCNYILKTLLNVKGITRLVVYCSDDSVVKIIPEQVEFLERDDALDKSSTTINEVIKRFSEDAPSDIYVLAHATSPFLRAKTIEKGLEAVVAGRFDSALAVKKIQGFLWQDGVPANYDPENIPRTQDLCPLFQETAGLYIFKHDDLAEFGRRIGKHPFLLEVDEIEATDIDNPIDFEIADALASRLFSEVL